VIVDVRHDLADPNWGEREYRAVTFRARAFAHLDRDLSAPKTGRNGRHPLPTPESAAAVFGRLGIDDRSRSSSTTRARACSPRDCGGCSLARSRRGGGARRRLAQWKAETGPVTTDVPRRAGSGVRGPARAADGVGDGRRGEPAASHAGAAWTRAPRSAFAATVEPLDPVAGHIPGALNRPYTRNVKPDGTFRPRASCAANSMRCCMAARSTMSSTTAARA
jgi:thiosulfate/3-mercaptopyruvate sulfurtransferase